MPTTPRELSGSGIVLGVCVLFLFACGLAEAVAVYIWKPGTISTRVCLLVAYPLVTGTLILTLGQAARPLRAPTWAGWAVAGCGLAASAVIAQTALQAFPNSGDEYGYNYIADTFLRGRLWNAPVAPELRHVFETYYIADLDGKRASQYPPGWPAVLSLFKLANIAQYGNALVGLGGCVCLWLALGRVRAPPGVRLGTFILGALAPFTVFNNASYFNHSLTAACLVAIIWLDLREAGVPSFWNRVGIGFTFSILLTTRYEAFLIAFLLFTVDGLTRKRVRFIRWATPAAISGFPVTVLLLWYNWRITGNPFQTTLAWASPDITYGFHATGIDGPHSLARGLVHTARWTLSWQDFASVVVLPLYAITLWRRVLTKAVRWFDLLLPALVAFFVFYPDSGGFQHGPRYWYFGHAALPVTIAAGLPSSGGLWQLGRRRLDPMRIALLQLASFAGFTLGYAAFLRLQTDARTTPFRVAATAPKPALVLMPDVTLRDATWGREDDLLQSKDYTRNGVDGFGAVVIGRDLGTERTGVLCRDFPDRHVFRLVLQSAPPRGHLEPVCN